MKSLNQIYKILLEQYPLRERKASKRYLCTFILSVKEDGYITKDEFGLLCNHFNDQKPTAKLHPDFYFTPLRYPSGGGGDAWWYLLDDLDGGIEIRTEFLKRMIQITK